MSAPRIARRWIEFFDRGRIAALGPKVDGFEAVLTANITPRTSDMGDWFSVQTVIPIASMATGKATRTPGPAQGSQPLP